MSLEFDEERDIERTPSRSGGRPRSIDRAQRLYFNKPLFSCRECLKLLNVRLIQCSACGSFNTFSAAPSDVVEMYRGAAVRFARAASDEEGDASDGEEEDERDEEDDEEEEDEEADEEEDEDPEDEERPPVRRAGSIKASTIQRLGTGVPGFDEVLGGGMPEANCLMLAAAPGAGKSTIMREVACAMAHELDLTVLYIAAEEADSTVKAQCTRQDLFKRFPKAKRNLLILNSDDPEYALEVIDKEDVDVVIVDSLMVMQSKEVSGPAGKEKQLNHCAKLFMHRAHAKGAYKDLKPVTIFTVCHATKSGDMAGVNTAKHWTDGAFYIAHIDPVTLEDVDDQNQPTGYVVLRTHGKYRWGSMARTYFRMTDKGLVHYEPGEAEDAEEREITGRQAKGRGRGRQDAPSSRDRSSASKANRAKKRTRPSR